MNNIKHQLEKLATGNSEYAQFNQRIVNTKKTVLGVRVPDLRKLAKQLACNMGYAEITKLLHELNPTIYEQVLLCGLIIAHAKLTTKQKITLTKKYLKLTDSWAEIDIFVQKSNPPDKLVWWEFALACLDSRQEFVVRYGIIELMTNFLDDDHFSLSLKAVGSVQHSGYYVKMAQAWFYATAATKNFPLVIEELEINRIDVWTKRKAIQKMLESYRISVEQKLIVRQLKQG